MPTNAARYQTCPTNGGGVGSYVFFLGDCLFMEIALSILKYSTG